MSANSKKLIKPMTKQGYHRLVDEFNHLRNEVRPKVVQGVADAAAEGDRSENAEYIYGKKRLREIDKRLRYLTSLLKDVQVIDPDSLAGDHVCFGATAVVENTDGLRKHYMLVGEGESDAAAGKISWRSPVGRALMSKKVGDFIEVTIPAGDIQYEIVGIVFGSRLE